MDFTSKFDHREPDYNLAENDILSVLRDFSVGKVEKIEPLSGGYSNTNLKITVSGEQPLILRISNNPQNQFEAEIAILKSLKNKVTVPAVYDYKLDHPLLHRHVALLEFLHGTLLSVVEDDLEIEDIRSIAAQLGSCLATIHGFTFTKSGFLGKDFNIADSFPSFYAGYYEYLQQCLKNERLAQRLSSAELLNLKTLVLKNRDRINNLVNVTSLIHSDFNQKNILVNKERGKWGVTGILDWEFTFSGSPLIDLGNFFRFEEEMPGGYKTAFIDAYKQNGGYLEQDWQHTAKILDLLSMVQFLTREGDYPKTFSTAQSVINFTLSSLM